MASPYPAQLWFEQPDFIQGTLSLLANEEWSLSLEDIRPLVLALAPALADPGASRKGAELAAITLHRRGLPASACTGLIESLATLTAKGRPDLPAALIDRQRQRLIARAVDTLERRSRAELRSALASGSRDPLTGLINRRTFIEALNVGVQRAERTQTCVALALIDISTLAQPHTSQDPRDRDRLLVDFARKLASLTRSTDTVACLGDGSFALLVEGLRDREAMSSIIQRELQDIAETTIFAHNDPTAPWHVGLAISPDDGDDPLALLDTAEAALGQSMEGTIRPGLNLVMPPLPPSHSRTSTAQIHSLIALGRDHLDVRYQPIVDLRTGKIARVEALVRLNTPSGVTGPEEFLTSLSKGERGRVFEAVLTQAGEGVASTGLSIPVSINIEPDLISDGDRAQSIINYWRKQGLDPHQLGIEITETQDLVSLAYGPLSLLRAAGHHIALDDFGSGYASLSRIMSFPFDEIKLDRSFSEPIELLNVGLPLVTVAIDASELMGVELVIEGIEDPRMLPVLRALGARFGQGYALARPLTLAQLLTFPNPLSLPTTTSYPLVVAAVQSFRWERAMLSFAASEGAHEHSNFACTLEEALVHPDLIELHRAQHALIPSIVDHHDQSAITELGKLGKELRRRVSTRLMTS